MSLLPKHSYPPTTAIADRTFGYAMITFLKQ